MIRRLLYGRKVFECRCGDQFKHEVEYEAHYRRVHIPEDVEAAKTGPSVSRQDPATGRWEPAIPLPGYFRERHQADW